MSSKSPIHKVRVRRDSKMSKKSTSSSTMASAAVSPVAPVHYNDWPNAVGFDAAYEEHEPVELIVQGHIPAYTAGTLFRTAIGPRSIKDKSESCVFRTNHWFDGFSQIHRFQLHAPSSTSASNPHASIEKVTYNSRLTSDGLITKIQKEGKLDGFTFAAQYEPCKSFFQKVQSVFEKAPEFKFNEVNNAVTMSINYPGLSHDPSALPPACSKIKTLVNKTDASRVQLIDPRTLEPLGLANQATLHPKLKGVMSGAHAKSCPKTGDVYNYNLDFSGPKATYNVFRTSPTTGKTTILATISHAPAYLHSIFLSSNFVILCIWNSHFTKAGASILWHKNILDAIRFNPDAPATWYVIDRRCPDIQDGKGVIAKYESDPFFAFHTINAYEVPSASEGYVDILCDIPIFANTDVLHHFYMDNIMSSHSLASETSKSMKEGRYKDVEGRLRRYRLPKVPSVSILAASEETKVPTTSQARIDFTCPANLSPELPTINFEYFTRPHRYVYGITGPDGTKSTFVDGLVKYDLLTQTAILWEEKGHTPGEAIFVANPHGSSVTSNGSGNNQQEGAETGTGTETETNADNAEDDGVLLTVVLDGYKESSYLLCLDAKTMQELGRVEVGGPVGFGFHGVWTNLEVDADAGAEEVEKNGTGEVVMHY